VTRWMTALRKVVSARAYSSQAFGMLLFALSVLALNYYASLELQWTVPSEDGEELFLVPLLIAPLGGAILAGLHGLAPRYKWRSVFALFVLTAAIMREWAILHLLPPFLVLWLPCCGIGYLGMWTWMRSEPRRVGYALTVLALLLFTYVHVLTLTFIPSVRVAMYPSRLITEAKHEERDRLLAAARELGIDPTKEMTASQSEALVQTMGPDRVVGLPLIGRSVRIHPSGSGQLSLSMHWDDGRFGTIDLKTLDVPYVSD
jgi:hypothetical protein